jgi:hypothetical protein
MMIVVRIAGLLVSGGRKGQKGTKFRMLPGVVSRLSSLEAVLASILGFLDNVHGSKAGGAS